MVKIKPNGKKDMFNVILEDADLSEVSINITFKELSDFRKEAERTVYLYRKNKQKEYWEKAAAKERQHSLNIKEGLELLRDKRAQEEKDEIIAKQLIAQDKKKRKFPSFRKKDFAI